MRRAITYFVLLAACGGKEATEMQLAVAVDSSGVETVTTDLGYTVELLEARAALRDLEFTTLGEEHETGAMARVWNWLVPAAYAHPGHSAGGDVTGELRGDFVIDWLEEGQVLGRARILTGHYEGANFSFRKASTEDGLSEGDPLVGHTFHLGLRVTRGDETWELDATLDLDEDTQLIGAPFQHEVTPTSAETIGIALVPEDPFEGNTLFDGIEFSPLDEDGDGHIVVEAGQSVHNQMRRLVRAHDFYFLEAN